MKKFTLLLLICIPFLANAQVSIDTIFFEDFNAYEDSTRLNTLDFKVWEGPGYILSPATNADAGTGYDGSNYAIASNQKVNFVLFRTDTLDPGVTYVFEAVTKIQDGKSHKLQVKGAVTGGNIDLGFNNADWQRHKALFTVDTAGSPIKTRIYRYPKKEMGVDNWILRTVDPTKTIIYNPFGNIDEANKIVEYPKNKDVNFLEANLKTNLNASFEVLAASQGDTATGTDIVSETMVIEVMAEDSTKQEYAITLIDINYAASITITSTDNLLAVPQSLQLNAEILPAEATIHNIGWSVAQPQFASIDENGILTAKNPGTVDVIASTVDGTGLKDTLTIEVYTIPVETITVSANSDSVLVTNTITLSAEVLPADASDLSITWSLGSAADSAIASINNGVLTPDTLGTVTVIATANDGSGISGSKDIKIYPITLVESITITANADSIEVGDGLLLTANVLPENTTDKAVTWSVVLNGGDATIDNRGILTGVAEGMVQAVATAKDNSGVTATFDVKVYVAPVVSVAEKSSIDAKLYPNPTRSELNIVTGKGNSSYRIHNMLGQFVRAGEFSMQTTLFVKDLDKGVYFIEIGSGTERNILKFIKE